MPQLYEDCPKSKYGGRNMEKGLVDQWRIMHDPFLSYAQETQYDLWDGGEAHNEDHFGCLDVNLQANQIKEKIIWDAYVYAYIRSI